MSPADALEERRKKTTLRKVKREHAGKVVQPYAIMEKLIDDVPAFAALQNAKIVIVWKSGWRPTKDDILKHAQIRKLSELEREIWGDEYDLCMMLHRELWQSGRFSEQEREMDIFHELCHPVAEIDDKTGDQKKDDRGRRCWRLRTHPIQRFAEEIARYGIDEVLKLDESAREAVDDEMSQEEARAEENDRSRPLLAAAEKTGNGEPPEGWKSHAVSRLAGLTDKALEALAAADVETLGELQASMNRYGQFWTKELGMHGRYRVPIEDAFNAYLVQHASEPEEPQPAEQDEANDLGDEQDDEFHPDAVRTVRVHLLKTITADGVNLGMVGTVVEAFQDHDGTVFLAQKGDDGWVASYLEAEEFDLSEEAPAMA